MTTACRVRAGLHSQNQPRGATQAVHELLRERHHPVPGAVISVIVGWWLSKQRLTSKPWLEEDPIGDFPGTGA